MAHVQRDTAAKEVGHRLLQQPPVRAESRRVPIDQGFEMDPSRAAFLKKVAMTAE